MIYISFNVGISVWICVIYYDRNAGWLQTENSKLLFFIIAVHYIVFYSFKLRAVL